MFQYKDLKIEKYLQSGFRLEFGSKIIYIDPIKLPKDQPKADLILISHEHDDHCELESIKNIYKNDTVVLGNKLVNEKVKDIVNEMNFHQVEPCSSGNFNGIKFTCVAAYNTNKFREPGIAFHLQNNQGIGFILDFIGLDRRIRLYHMGDTDYVQSEHAIPEVDILMIPVSGTYVMTKEEAVYAANDINPKLSIPMHHDAGIVGSKSDGIFFKENASMQVEILEPVS